MIPYCRPLLEAAVQKRSKANLVKLNEQSELSIQNTYDRAGNVIADADAEIARLHQINATIDELELEFDKTRHIRDIVKTFRGRIESLDHRLDQASTPSSRKRR